MKPALRGCALLAAAVGLAAVSRPIERIDRRSEARADVSRAGDEGDGPAIRSGTGCERQVAYATPIGLAPPLAAGSRVPAARSTDCRRRSCLIDRSAARSNRARGPPPSA